MRLALITYCLLLIALLLPGSAYAQISLPNSPADAFSSNGFIGQVITKFLPPILAIGGFLTVIFIVIAGIQFVTSGGDPKGAAAARARLTYALVGLIILILAFAVLQAVDKLFLGGTGIT